MAVPRMPTTLPRPVDRGGFRFVAVDACGVVWRRVDEEMAWRATAPEAESGNGRPCDGGGGWERRAADVQASSWLRSNEATSR